MRYHTDIDYDTGDEYVLEEGEAIVAYTCSGTGVDMEIWDGAAWNELFTMEGTKYTISSSGEVFAIPSLIFAAAPGVVGSVRLGPPLANDKTLKVWIMGFE